MRRGCLFVLPLLFASGQALAGPAWVDGKDPRYSSKEYLLGVGKGPSRAQADIDARAEISRVFESKVAAVMEDFQAFASKVNESGKGVSVDVQKVTSFQQVTTKGTLEAVELREHAEQGGVHFSLGVLSREKCVNSTTEKIKTLDEQIRAALSQAEGADKLRQFASYGKAMNLMDEREGQNAMLRVCNGKGQGIEAPIGLGELSAKFQDVGASLRIGVKLQGNGAERVRDCLMEKLGDKGYELIEVGIDEEEAEEEEEEEEEGGQDFDAILNGHLKSEKRGEVEGSAMVETELTLKLVNGKSKKVLKTFSGKRTEGRRDIRSSAALAAFKICQKSVPDIVKAISKYFSR